MPQVVILDESGAPAGTLDRTAAHTPPGRLHLAVSVFLRHPDGRHLLQRRAPGKTFPGRWANACCTHPLPGEGPAVTAARRLGEELGLTVALTPVGEFRYRAHDPHSGMVEHEQDLVFVGVTATDPRPDPEEVVEWRWVEPAELASWLSADPPRLAPWVPAAVAAFPELLA